VKAVMDKRNLTYLHE